MLSMVNPMTEKHIFCDNNYYCLEDFAKFNGYNGFRDKGFLDSFGIEDINEWSDGIVADWLSEQKNYELDFILDTYRLLEHSHYIVCVSWVEYWNTKGYTEITPLKKIMDILNYRGAFELTDIYEGQNYLKFCISHHDGNDVYYLFFNEKEYNSSLSDDIENCILDGLDYDYYKPLENKYNNMIKDIIREYDIDYLKSCININKKLHSE